MYYFFMCFKDFTGETEAHLANYQPGVALVSFARNSVSHAICEKSSPAGSIAI